MADETITRESLGRLVREVWVTWAREQQDVVDHPSWTALWDELADRDREVDMRIGETVAAAERARIRRGVLACEMVLQHPVDGDRVAVLTLDLEQVIGAEDGSAGEAGNG